MVECFCISFFAAKNNENLKKIKSVFNANFGFKQGENYIQESSFSILKNKKTVFFWYDAQETDYLEFQIALPYQLFHKKSFDKELASLSQLVDFCFGLSNDFLYVLCSYECNEYFLRDVDGLKDINDKILMRFPIVFVNKKIEVNYLPVKKLKHSKLIINHAAQDLFSVM